jgi:hypothetical protein
MVGSSSTGIAFACASSTDPEIPTLIRETLDHLKEVGRSTKQQKHIPTSKKWIFVR